jgi:hypothetical protein
MAVNDGCPMAASATFLMTLYFSNCTEGCFRIRTRDGKGILLRHVRAEEMTHGADGCRVDLEQGLGGVSSPHLAVQVVRLELVPSAEKVCQLRGQRQFRARQRLWLANLARVLMMGCNFAAASLANGCRGLSREVGGRLWLNFSFALPSGQAPRGSALPLLPPTKASPQPRCTRRPGSGPRQLPSTQAPPGRPGVPPSPEKGLRKNLQTGPV